MARGEFDWAEVPYPETMQGRADAGSGDDDDDHGPHVFLYVPDISMETGWSTHRVPDRKTEKGERRQVGFHR